ncbi:Tad domain-containing protein [Shewanella woodyi]|uniref:Tad domain-containing protein n=1 Tax=Shewanella woodyi TaxID=60961 RepID=UPI0007F8F712|nr:Tad domain-containing protein [Shewanella woodyi]
MEGNKSLSTRKSKSQSGYASILFLALFASVALSIFSLYDVGTVSSERIRLQNTADNVAYSTTNMVTRDLNVIAITNRAMVANQVAIGQVVALSSWSNMVHEFSGNLETLGDWVRWIPYVGQFIERFTEIIHQAATALRNGIKRGGSAFIFAEDKLITLLSTLQQTNHEATLLSAKGVFDDIVKKNDPDVSASPIVNAYNIVKFVQAYRGSNQTFKRNQISRQRTTAQRFAEFSNVTNDSRDYMMANRGYRVFGKFPIPWGCFIGKAWADKRGGTDFNLKRKRRSYQWNWTSLDTFSFWLSYRSGWRCKKRTREWIPLGWGAGHVLDKQLRTDRYRYDGRERRQSNRVFQSGNWKQVNYNKNQSLRAWGDAWHNSNSANLVDTPSWHQGESKADIDNNLRRVSGVRNFIDFKSNKKTNDGPEFSVLLTKNERNIRTQKTLDRTNGQYNRTDTFTIEKEGGIPSDSLFSLASAQSYFSRPDELKGRSKRPWMIKWGRKDKLKEYGNLYNPFWQTKLKKSDDNIIKLLLSAGVIS